MMAKKHKNREKVKYHESQNLLYLDNSFQSYSFDECQAVKRRKMQKNRNKTRLNSKYRTGEFVILS